MSIFDDIDKEIPAESKLIRNASYALQEVQIMLDDDRKRSGYVTCVIAGKWVQAKVYDNPSTYGINNGRVSKLAVCKEAIMNPREPFFEQLSLNYDRGMDFNTLSKEEVDVIVNALEKLPKCHKAEITELKF